MDRKFLEEYEKAEEEEFNKLCERMFNGDFGPNDTYPPDSRFPKLRKPVIGAFQLQGDPKLPSVILPQILLSGSLVIELLPLTEKDFKDYHGFDIRDIPKLVEFSKETGKVQFVLHSNATSYEGLSYLDPIFIELRPPQIPRFPLESILLGSEFKKYVKEFDEVARVEFKPLLWRASDEWFFGTKYEGIDYYFDSVDTFLYLKALGKNHIAEQILSAFRDDPEFAQILLYAYNEFVYAPFLDVFRISYNYDLEFVLDVFTEFLEKEDKAKLLANIKFPCEVGAFLMKKLTLYPQSFRAMELLVDKYEQEDLYNVFEALDNGIKAKSPDILTLKATELGEILDNLWEDSKKIKREIKEVNFGTSVTLGVIGPIVGYMVAGFTGLLVALGLAVVEKNIDFFGTSISESIVKKLRPSYLVNIYDFKSKYSIG